MTTPKFSTRLRRARAAVVVTMFAGVQLLVPGMYSSSVSAAQNPESNIRICHATSSKKNPFVSETVDPAGAYNGHYGSAHQGGKDIIPLFRYDGKWYSQNWDVEGIAIWNSGCTVKGAIRVNKKIDANNNGYYEGGNITANNVGVVWGLDDETPASKMGEKVSDLAAGTYTVSETAPSDYVFTGWYYEDERGRDCSNPNGTEYPVPVTVSNKTVEITLCNQAQPSTITVRKVTDPANDQTPFTITAHGDGTITGEATRTITTAAPVVYTVKPGTYSVAENAVTGWEQSANTCFNVTIKAGEDLECTITNTKLATVSGTKHETNADQTNVGTVANVPIKLQQDGQTVKETVTGDDGTYSFSDVRPGNYTVVEDLTDLSGWTQIYAPAPIALTAGSTQTGQDFGNFENGSATGYKFNDENGNGRDDEEQRLSDWEITLYSKQNGIDQRVDAIVTGEDGAYSFDDLAPGTYRVCETEQDGWYQTYPEQGCHEFVIDVSGEVVEGLAFGNQQLGSITIAKDADPDSSQAFTFYTNIETEDCSEETESCAFTLTDAGGESNNAMGFEGLIPGWYYFSEEQARGWDLTGITCDTEYAYEEEGVLSIDLRAGQNVTCFFTNKKQPAPQLTLAKTNNRSTTKAGDIVTYTLTVTNTSKSAVYDATVTDLPPENFTYIPGSWSAVSSLATHDVAGEVVEATGEPTYGSPGDWFIGNVLPGEVITLTYRVFVEKSVTPGAYQDLAFVKGVAVDDTTVLGGCTGSCADGVFASTTVQIAAAAVATPVTYTARKVSRVELADTGVSLVIPGLIVPLILITSAFAISRVGRTSKKGITL